MNKTILGYFIALMLPVAHGWAQDLNQVEKNTVVQVMEGYTQGIKVGNIDIDSINMSSDTLTLFFNSAFNNVPIRLDNAKALTEAIGRSLPERFAHHNLRIMIAGHELGTLIPRSLQKGSSRRPAFSYSNATPLVTNLSRPYPPTQGLANRHIAIWQSHGKYFEAGYNRWEWQRARLFESVEDKFTQSFVLPYVIPMLENAGAVVMTPRERDTNPYEVIVDNDGQLAASPYRETNGRFGWTKGAGVGFAYCRPTYVDFQNPFTEGTYRQVQTVRKDRDASTIVWAPDLPVERHYAVYVSYQTLPNSTDDARYTVYHKGGTTSFRINQQMGGGTWIYLGTFAFDRGTGGKVVLTNVSSQEGVVVTADAVRFGGGMGNIARCADGDSISGYTKGGKGQIQARNEWQPSLTFQPETSGYPRYLEGARYYMQWAGIPDSIYSPSHGKNDYTDDYRSRGMWVNYLAGGTKAWPDAKGLNIPVDLSFAFHTDAGTVYGDSIIGTLGIYQTSQYGGQFADGSSRDANRDLCDLVLTSITNDVRVLAEPDWTRRGMWNQRYYEAWVPRVPAMLLELMSHQNFADMRFGLDPRFRFIVSRAIYKGMLRYLSDAYGYDYIVQPLPVTRFSAIINKKKKVELNWHATIDSLEPTAQAERFIVYKRIGDGDFDNGTVVKKNTYTCDIPTDKVVSFKVTAINKGGESFPSEILSVGINSESTEKPVLVINGFDRISGPDDFRSADDALAGFLADDDNGVPDKEMISYVGKMKEFRRSIPWTDDDASGFGDSYGNYERIVVAGNSFDYPALHGRSILKAGYSFVSMSRSAITADDKSGSYTSPVARWMTASTESKGQQTAEDNPYSAIDLILGKEKQSKFGRPGLHPLAFKTFDAPMQTLLTNYCRQGGRVFVSGAYVGTDLWQNPIVKGLKEDQMFAESILKYKWREDRAATEGRIRYVVSPLAAENTSFEYYNLPNEESYVVESPDAIVPADPAAYTAFRYPENGMSAGIVFGGNAQDSWRTVVLAFPFESIKDPATRDQLMKHVLRFLFNPSR